MTMTAIRLCSWAVLLTVAGIALGGCAEYYAGAAAGRELAREVGDAELRAAQYADCVASSMGANLRRYGNDPMSWEMRRINCRALAGATEIAPQPPMRLAPEPIAPPTAYRPQPMPFQGPGV